MDSNLRYRGTKTRDFGSISDIADGSNTGERRDDLNASWLVPLPDPGNGGLVPLVKNMDRDEAAAALERPASALHRINTARRRRSAEICPPLGM